MNRELECRYDIRDFQLSAMNKYEAEDLPELLKIARKKNKSEEQMLEDIFYTGEHGDFKLTEGLCSHDSASECFERRIELLNLYKTNYDTFIYIVTHNIGLFHGTNSNALPNIIVEGIKSAASQNSVVTGEAVQEQKGRSRESEAKDIQLPTPKPRRFSSFTDDINTAIEYSKISPKFSSKVLTCGIIIGISPTNLDKLRPIPVNSKCHEICFTENILPDRINAVFVPTSRIEVFSRIVKSLNPSINVLGMSTLSEPQRTLKTEEVRDNANSTSFSLIQPIIDTLINLREEPLNDKSKGIER